jgi:hypothetical protein
MLKSAIIAIAAIAALAGSACAGDRYGDRYAAPPPPAPGSNRYYGPVNNYYGPVTIYAAPDGGNYPATQAGSYPAYGAYYGPGYATAPGWDANSYGAGYDWSQGYGYGAGNTYPAYGYGYGYPPGSEAQRLDPWAGYNGGWNNGYW